MRFFSITRLLAALAVTLCLVGPSAQAQTTPFLDLAITPASQTAAPGGSPFWNIQFTNNNELDTAFFTLIGFDEGLGSVPDVAVPPYDFTPFGQQLTLAPGESIEFPAFFQSLISPLAVNAVYVSVADATYDLYDSANFDNLLVGGATASAEWTLNVQGSGSVAPEPGTLALLASMTIPGALILRRRIAVR